MSASNINEIMKIKDFFPKLSPKEIHKIVNKKNKILKPRINITTKGPSRRQVLVLMNPENSRKFKVLSGQHIANINRALKNITLEVLENYIRNDNKGLTIVTNKVTLRLDLDTIEKYIKNTNVVKSEEVIMARLLQLKLYFKILYISYLIEDTNVLIFVNAMKKVIQSTHIFNEIVFASKPRIIKV